MAAAFKYLLSTAINLTVEIIVILAPVAAILLFLFWDELKEEWKKRKLVK